MPVYHVWQLQKGLATYYRCAICGDVSPYSKPPGECAYGIRRALITSRKDERDRIIAILEDCLRCYDPAVFSEPPPGEHGTSRDQCSAAAIRGFLTPLIARLRTGTGVP